MLFSLRRKAPKDSPRRCLGLSFIYWKVYTHGSQQLFALASLGKPTFAVRRVCTAEKLAPAGAKLSEHTHCPFGVFRRGLHEFTSANTCREPMKYIFGSHKRSSGTLAVSFRSFLVRTRKGHVSPFQRRRNVVFSPTRKRRKESPRRCLGLPSICWEAYTHGSKGVAVLAGLAQATTPRAGRNCEWEVRARRRKARAV